VSAKRTAEADWRRRREPVTVDEITDAMLEPVRRAARASGLPQTVFASRWHGRDFQGVDCLLTSAAAALLDWEPPEALRPANAAAGSMPMVTLLPPLWWPPVENYPADLSVTPFENTPQTGAMCTGCGYAPKHGAVAWADQHGDQWCNGCVTRMRDAGLLRAGPEEITRGTASDPGPETA
jgi:hypothetical protein